MTAPTTPLATPNGQHEKTDAASIVANGGVGTLPDEVYEGSMAPWRAALRSAIMYSLRTESQWIAAAQERLRSPMLDAYFLYSSTLGSHTFFLMFLPLFFFFGHDQAGRGLIYILCMGVYVTSFMKDLVCSPRPHSPPVTRLTIGSHHLEYGFPSTHSTNSVSISLFLYELIYDRYRAGSVDKAVLYVSAFLLAWYTLTIVLGRLYNGMHSFTDCFMGVVVGVAIWLAYWIWGGAAEHWVVSSGWIGPVTVAVLGLIMVNQHPQPVEDCPCFEDSIACIAVIMGALISKWHAVAYGLDASSGFFVSRTPGWQARDTYELSIWLGISVLKMVLGILLIFTWRLVAKGLLHTTLPPLFRILATLFTLPNRRFYTPATDYKSVPAEKALQPIPSMVDLHASVVSSSALPRSHVYRADARGPMRRNGARVTVAGSPEKEGMVYSGEGAAEVKHYDADVLTKVVVYCGIGALACELLPVLFEVLGWGVKM